MMKDIEIKINRETRMVDLSKSIIGNDGENLQGNLVFSFADEFVKGQARLEYVIDDEKKYALLLKGEDNYYIPIKSVMTKAGTIDMQLVVTEGTNENEIPIFKSNMFYVTCRTSINAEIKEEEGYYSWIEIANTKLNQVDEAIEELASQSNYAKDQGDYAKEQGTNAKNVADDTQKKAEDGLFNGKSLEFVWEGTKLGVRLEGQEEYQFVDLQGVQGEIGATGEPFKIKKTYGSVSEMNADFGNMKFGDYVMIASSVDVEDNAKLYTRGESAWIFISDFSGAMGIRGETGLTPNIKIGEVKTLEAGSQAKVTRSGSNEEPVFNFELPKGDKGDDYVLTEEDKVEIGEKVNTEYEKRIAENEKDIVDIESYLDNLTPKSPPVKGELVHITDALNLPVFETKTSGNVKQETTTGKQLLDVNTIKSADGTISDGITTSQTLGNWGGMTWRFPNIILSRTIYYVSFDLRIKSGTCNQLNKLNMWDSGVWFESYDFIAKPTPSNIYQRYCIKFDLTDNTTIYNLDSINLQVGSNVVDAILEVKDIMVSISSDYTYEKFTGGQASPNPEFPQEVEVVEGYNLFDKNNANILYDTYIGTGGNVGSSPTNNILYLEIKPNTSYTIQKISSNRFRVGTYNSLDIVGKTLNNIIKNLNDSITSYTLKNTTDKYLFFQYLGGDKNEQEILDSIIINEGTDKNPYLPYGCVGYKVNGKNLIYSQNRIGTNLYPNGLSNQTSYIFKAGTYAMSYKSSKSVQTYYSTPTKPLVLLTNNKEHIFTMDEDFEIWLYASGLTDEDVTEWQLETGDKVTPYEPFQEQIVPLDLKGNWVGKINDDIKDYLVTDKKKLWLVKNVNRGLIAMNNHSYETEYTMWFFFSKPTDSIDYGKYTTHGFSEVCLDDTTKPIYFSGKGNTPLYAIVYEKSKIETIPTLEEIKTLANGKYFYYQLATPQIIDLGELPEPIKTFESTNNIQVLANLDTEIEVKYALDLKKYYDNKLAEISAQII